MNGKYTRFAMRMLCKLNEVSRMLCHRIPTLINGTEDSTGVGVKGVYMMDLARKTRHLRTTCVHYPLVKKFVTW